MTCGLLRCLLANMMAHLCWQGLCLQGGAPTSSHLLSGVRALLHDADGALQDVTDKLQEHLAENARIMAATSAAYQDTAASVAYNTGNKCCLSKGGCWHSCSSTSKHTCSATSCYAERKALR